MQERRVQELGVVRGVKCYPKDTEKALEDLAMQSSLVTSLQESSLPEVVGKNSMRSHQYKSLQPNLMRPKSK